MRAWPSVSREKSWLVIGDRTSAAGHRGADVEPAQMLPRVGMPALEVLHRIDGGGLERPGRHHASSRRVGKRRRLMTSRPTRGKDALARIVERLGPLISRLDGL